jgi:hypothetical protein
MTAETAARTVPFRPPGFARMLKVEFATGLGVRHLVLLAAFPVLASLLTVWMPTFPRPVYDFFAQVFRVRGWTDIVLVNVYTGLFFVLYWFGVVDALRIYVAPLEERHLALIMSKPLRRSTYMLARLTPIFTVLVVAGGAAAVASLITLDAMALPADTAAILSGSAISIALALVVLALVNLLMLWTRDTYTAMGVAFLPMFVFFLPTAVYMYRPDIFEGRQAALDLLTFPLNLVWRSADLATIGGPVALALSLVAAILGLAAGWLLERRAIS